MHTHFLCSNLRQRGHEVTLFAASGSETPGLEAISGEMPMGVESFAAEHHVYLELMHTLQSRSFDIVHNNSLHYLPVAMSGSLPMPMITTLHTPPFWELEGSMRLSHSSQHCFVAVSDLTRRAWQPINGVERVIANGIDLARFAFRAIPDSAPYAIWYGRIVPEKGLHLALDAARAADIPLRFAGPIADRAYFAESIQPRMSASVRYLGHVSHPALADAIAGARVFLCTPIWEEPYGLVAAESLSCGTPVAAFARGAIPDLLDLNCGVLAAPGDVNALAAAARSAQNLSRFACRRRAETVCDSRKMLDAYERLYHAMDRHQTYPRQRPARSGEVAAIQPDRQSLIELYRRSAASMLCDLPLEETPACPA